MRRAVAVLLLAASPLVVPAAARAEEPVAPKAEAPVVKDAPEGAAKDALARFEREIADPNPKLRVDAVKRVGKVIHPTVATALFDFATKSEDQVVVRTAAFRELAAQTTSAKTVGPKLAKYLGAEVEENRKRKARGDYGLKVDVKTNKTDTESPEGKELLRIKRERGQFLAEGLRAWDAMGFRDRDSVDLLVEFLGDGNDDLVAHALGMLGKWKEWSTLRDLLELYEMYPAEDKVNVGSTAVDTGSAGSGDQQAAKRNWMAKYGDPDRRRARPPVVRALKKALTDITGETFETPDALREYLRRPDVKRKVR